MDQPNRVWSPVTKRTKWSEFPTGMRVLAVDNNIIDLRHMVSLLEECRYKVAETTSAMKALELLREAKSKYDVIITEVNIPDIDGFKLTDIVGLEMGIPVVLVSWNDDQETVMRGIIHGARDFLSKPLRLQELKKIWQHVLRTNLDASASHKSSLTREISTSTRRSHEAEEEESVAPSDDAPRPRRKRRLSWTKELHDRFIAAIQQLGEGDAVPNNILKVMNVPGLTRENIASHLQKYRNSGKKKSTEVRPGIIGFNWNGESSTGWSHPAVNALQNTQLPVDISYGVLKNGQPPCNYFDHAGLQNPLLVQPGGAILHQLQPPNFGCQYQQAHSPAVTQQFQWSENIPSPSLMAYACPALQPEELSLRPRPLNGYGGISSTVSSSAWARCQTEPSCTLQCQHATANGFSEEGIQTRAISSAARPGQNFQTSVQNEGGWSLNLGGSGDLKCGEQVITIPENATSRALKEEDERLRQVNVEKENTFHDIGFDFFDDDDLAEMLEKFNHEALPLVK